jgi:hypothetical protein
MAILDTNEMMFTAFEPKLQNRFIMYIDGIPAFLVKKVGRPNIQFGDVTLDHINVKRKLKGKADWQDITCESVTGRDGYSDFYKKDIRFNALGPVGDVVEEWILKGAYCKQANFGDADWTSDTPMNISITIRMDYAILNY